MKIRIDAGFEYSSGYATVARQFSEQLYKRNKELSVNNIQGYKDPKYAWDHELTKTYTDKSDTWGGFEKKMIKMGEYNSAMGKELINEVKIMEEDFSSGKINSFSGPIKDNEGNLRIKAGEVATDEELLGMNYYVEGIEGKVPQ